MLRKALVLFMLLMLVLGSAFSVAAQDTIGIGDPVTATLPDSGEEFYELEVEAGLTYTVSVISDEFDPVVELLDEDEFFITSNDDGGYSTNSFLIFGLDDSGTYLLKVRGFGGGGAGLDYTILVDTISADPIGLGDSADVSFDGITPPIVAFELEEGTALQITVELSDVFDLEMFITDPAGSFIDSNYTYGGDTFVWNNVVINSDGVFYLVITPQSEGIRGGGTVTIEEVELQTLDKGPVVVTFDANLTETVFAFEAEAGVRYALTVSTAATEPVGIYVTVVQNGFTVTSISTSGGFDAGLTFEAPEDGALTVTLSTYVFEPTDFEISISAVE